MNNLQFKAWCESQHVSQISQQSIPLIMGVINFTPDSFSDGSCYFTLPKALKRAEVLIKAGADLLDIGGESSRPGAKAISVEEELNRVIPLIERIRAMSDICISIDTYKPEVMRAAVLAGAGMINDITALRSEEALKTASELQVPVCLMHMLGTPATMQQAPHYSKSVIDTILAFFSKEIERCVANGLRKEHLILDPGFGFGKTDDHNLQMIKHFEAFQCHKRRLMLGVSRKSTLGQVLNKPVHERLIAGIALSVIAAMKGVSILRTHDVEETKQALRIIEAVI